MQLNHLPAIFNPADQTTETGDVHITGNQQWVEFVSHMTRFTTGTIPETQSQLQLLLESDSDPYHSAMLTAGIGRCQIRQGRLLDGARSLGNAWNRLPETLSDAHSFIQLEMAGLLALIGSYDQSLILLNRALDCAQSEYLKKVGNYYGLVNLSRKGKTDILAKLDRSRKWFAANSQCVMEAYHLKNIGNIHRRNKDYNKTKRTYNRGIAIAEANGMTHIKADILHDLGMLEHHKGNFREAVRILEQAAELTENAYTQSFTTGNIGFLHFHRKDFTQSAQLFEKALHTAVEGGVFHLIPGACYYLGSSMQNLGQNNKSGQWLKQGYDAVMELVANHFPMTAFRQKVVKAYVDHLQELQSDTPKTEHELDFLLDKTLAEIRSIFQDSLLKMTLQQSAGNKEAIEKLNISPRTFYDIRKRVQSNDHQPVNAGIVKFWSSRQDADWKSLNKAFEQTALKHLYSRYGGRKKTLSEKLGISYAHTVKLTEGMDRQLMTVSVDS